MESGNPLYDWFGLNQGLFLLLNGMHAPLLDPFMLLCTRLGHPSLYPFYLAIAVLIAWRQPNVLPQRNVVTFALSFPVVSIIIVPALKEALDFPRPLTVFGEKAVTVLGDAEWHHSLPSGHAAFSVLLAASLMPGLPAGGRWTLMIFASLVCVSRLVVGAHFPADVMAGAAIALIVVWTIRAFLRVSTGK